MYFFSKVCRVWRIDTVPYMPVPTLDYNCNNLYWIFYLFLYFGSIIAKYMLQYKPVSCLSYRTNSANVNKRILFTMYKKLKTKMLMSSTNHPIYQNVPEPL